MTVQTTVLDSKLESLKQKAQEYDTRTNTEDRVTQAEEDLKELNRVLFKLDKSLNEFERQAGILTEVFEQSLPPKVTSARDEVRSITEITQDDILDTIDDSNRSLSTLIENVRDAREKVKDAQRIIDDCLKKIQNTKLSDASTAESIQKIIGKNPDAMDTIHQYRKFLKSILNPNDSVSQLKSQWLGIEKRFENLDTDWEGFRQRHNLSQQTIDDLKKLSSDGEVDLDDLDNQSVTEMLDVPELRSTIKVSL